MPEATPHAPSNAATNTALAYADQHETAFLDDLKEFLRIPSISTTPKHKADVRRAAKFVADQLNEIGLNRVQVIKTPLHPLVYGEWLEADGKPTVLIYGHYDVQPVDPLNEWQSPPFEPEVRNDNLYARGAVDDKGQVLGLLKALQSYMKSDDGKLPVNIKVLIEGEEEYGGESIEEYVKSHANRLACDAVLVADTHMPALGVPAIIYGLRGILYTEFIAKGAKSDLHSGTFGGVAPNPIHALALVLAGLKGTNGRITIPELYERLKPITDDERALWQRSPIDREASFKHEMGVDVLPGEQDYSLVERIGARPTLEVHGIVGGFVGEGAKTVIPAEATAKVSLRLPPELTPEEVLPLVQARVKELTPPGVQITVKNIHGGRGMIVPIDNVYVRAAEKALEQEWGRAPVLEREGGSIPVGALFAEYLDVPVIFAGTGLPDDNLHAPNEKYHVPNYYHLIRQTIRYLGILGSDPAVLSRPTVAQAKKTGKGSAKANGKANGASGPNGANGATGTKAGAAATKKGTGA